MDGHSSHVTANVIAFCMENAIDLLIIPPHTSHILQPLDVGVFAPLKRALASETDAALRLDSGRIARVQWVEWVEMYIRARQRALNKHNILSGWRSAGLVPLSPITVLGKLSGGTTSAASPPHIPPKQLDLDTSLLDSSPPDGTELRQATSLLIATMQGCAELPSPAKRFTERLTRQFEAANSENVTLRKQVKEQAELLHARKGRKTSKRVALKGQFVFSTQEVLDIARSAEAESSKKKSTSKPKKRRAKKTLNAEANGELDVVLSDSESDYIVVSMRE
jgi:hypothetical protein